MFNWHGRSWWFKSATTFQTCQSEFIATLRKYFLLHSDILLMWRKALRLCIPQDVNKMLIDPLGPWTDRSKHQWQWFFSPSNNRVYARHDNQWKVYKKNSPQGAIGKGTIFRYDTQAFTLPPHAQRATIVPFHNKIRLHGWSSDEDDPIPPEHDSTQWMIRNKYQLNHELGIANHLAKGEVVYAVSN